MGATVLAAEEIQRRASIARQVSIHREGTLADQLRIGPPGEFCPWGGLNPHLGVDAPCRGCVRNESDCALPFRAIGY